MVREATLNPRGGLTGLVALTIGLALGLVNSCRSETYHNGYMAGRTYTITQREYEAIFPQAFPDYTSQESNKQFALNFKD